jgi:hypothetical protein
MGRFLFSLLLGLWSGGLISDEVCLSVLSIRLILLVLYLLRVHATLHRPQGKSKALQDAVFMRFAVIWHDIEQVKKKTEEEKAQLYKFAADADKEARDTAFPSYEQVLFNFLFRLGSGLGQSWN